MPVIKINEIDNTVGLLEAEEGYVVFVPGNVGLDLQGNTVITCLGKTTLFTDLYDFRKSVGEKPYEYARGSGESPYLVDGEIQDPGFMTAYLLLSKGLRVLYKIPADNESVITTFDGFKSAMNATAVEEEDFFTELEDKNTWNVRFLTNGGYESVDFDAEETYELAKVFVEGETYYDENGDAVVPQPTEADFGEYVSIEIADATAFETAKTEHGSIFVFMDLGEDEGYVEINSYGGDLGVDLDYFVVNTKKYYVKVNELKVPNSIARIKGIAELRKDCIFLADHIYTLGSKATDADTILQCGGLIASTQGAMFSPWCSYEKEDLRFLAEDKKVILPASATYLEAFANSVLQSPTWYAAAGRLRGQINGKPLYHYTDKMCEKLSLQSNVDSEEWYKGVSVNPICNRRTMGTVVWGNRTLFNNTENELVASCFLNIRHLCLDLQKELYLQANNYMFEQNTDRLWFNFKSEIVSLLDSMQTGQGIEGYKIIKLPSQKRAQIRALVRIVPIEAVEEFDLTITLENSNVLVELA